MPSVDVLTLEMRARDRATGEIRKVEGSLGRLKGAVGGLQTAIGGLVAGVGIGLFVGFIRGAIVASAKAETTYNQLRRALQGVGAANATAARATNALAVELQATTRFGDDETQRVLTMLIQLTGSYSEATLRAARAVADFAEGAMQGRLEPASRLVAQAIAGNISALSRYLPSLKAVDAEAFLHFDVAERTRIVVDALATAFGGAATKISEMEKNLARTRNAWGDYKESVGKAYSEMATFEASGILQWLEDVVDVTQKGKARFENAEGAIEDFARSLIDGRVSTDDFNAALTRFHAAGIDVLALFKERGWTAAIDSYAQASNRATEATDEWAKKVAELQRQKEIAEGRRFAVEFGEEEGETFLGGAAAAREKERRAEAVRQRKQAEDDARQEAEAALAAAMQVAQRGQADLRRMAEQSAAAMAETVTAALGRGDWGLAIAAMQDLGMTLEDIEKRVQGALVDPEVWKKTQDEIAAAAREFEAWDRQVKEFVVQAGIAAATNAVETLTAALTTMALTGEAAFADLAAGMIRILTDLAKQLGTFFIFTGMGAGNPAMIAAGIGLTALSGILGAVGSAVGGDGGNRGRGGAGSPVETYRSVGGAGGGERGTGGMTIIIQAGRVFATDEEVGRAVSDALGRAGGSGGSVFRRRA